MLLDHLRALKFGNPKGDILTFTVFGYTHSIYSETKQKPIVIQDGQLDTKDFFVIDIDHQNLAIISENINVNLIFCILKFTKLIKTNKKQSLKSGARTGYSSLFFKKIKDLF